MRTVAASVLAVAVIVTAFLAADEPPSDAIRVACVGDSITYGSGVEERETNAYPAVLGRLLGEGYEVRNFGVGGTTAQKAGDYPYWKADAFKEATSFGPQVVVVKLGTNDSKPQNWNGAERYEADLAAFVEHFKNLPQKPQVFLCLPVPVPKDAFGIRDAVVRDEIGPAVRRIAEKTNVPVIDLYAALKEMPEAFPDGVHPDAAGAKRIAETVAKAIREHAGDSRSARKSGAGS